MRVFFLFSCIYLSYFVCRAGSEGICSRSFCNYRGVCVPSPKDNTTHCLCVSGFSGLHCELSSCPCLNGGSCKMSRSGKVCQCLPGFTGKHCEVGFHPSYHVCYSGGLCGKNGRCVPTSNHFQGYRCVCNRGFEGDFCQNCSAGFTGENCEIEKNECLSKPCVRGKCFAKAGSYWCECPEGFRGRNCEIVVDPCYNSSCKNEATCVAALNAYFCQCQPGFTGRYCDFRIETCVHGFCKNGGECVPSVYGNSCICPAGFTGHQCEHEVDVCGNNASVCQNGGTCINKNGEYHCICVSGWDGKNCEVNVDDCVDALCAEGSKCIDRVASYTCECPPGRTGTFCNLSDPCLLNPCKEGSECLVNSANGDYQCKCQNGFTGRDCSIDVDECSSLNITCGNNGTCVNTRGSWRCECDEGFFGAFCESSIERCSPNPCLNGGSCLDYRSRGECVCIGGFYGERCELKCPSGYIGKNCELQKCNNSSCLNGGLCLSGVCRCPPQYIGSRCESSISNPCASRPCAANAVCKLSANGIDYVCECERGFFGHDCSQKLSKCALNPCQHGGTCIDTFAGYVCRCRIGFYGRNCEENYDDCKQNPCHNGGTCIDGDNSFSCHCPMSFMGNLCETQMPNPCDESICGNNASCVPTPDFKSFRCRCSNGFKGFYCNEDVNECEENNLCQNGGTCKNNYGSYSCICPNGYVGQNCEHKKRYCSSTSCYNRGRCVEVQNGYRCECLAGFTGGRCEQNIDDCAAVDCKNGGTCIDRINDFMCQCRLGFSGRLCENNDDDCRPRLCLNNGTCVDEINSFHCECKKGFTGRNCQVKVNFEEYTRTDILDREICKTNHCELKAGNGVCDSECNFFACGYDGGDCSARNEPFEKCPFASFCAHNFHNDRCDQMCNNENCLFDGHDCDTVQEKCHKMEICSKVFGNKKCDHDCNNSGCGWDGGDCDESFNDNSKLDGDVILILLIHHDEFIKHMKSLLLTLSQTLRASVSVKLDNGKPMIYGWDSENGAGPRVDVPSLVSQENLVSSTRVRRSEQKLVGTMVILVVDTTYCSKDDYRKCFTDIASVASYLGAATAKQVLNDLDMPLYSAAPRLAKKTGGSKLLTTFIACLFFAFFGLAFVVIQQGRKRKILNARIWRPPTNDSGKSSSTNIDTYSIHSGFHYSEFGSLKRMRTELNPSSRFLDDDKQSFLPPKTEKCRDERQWNVLHQEAMLKSPVSTPVKPSLVNVKGKYGRTALMLVVLNEQKNDMAVEKDIDCLLSAGADIDLGDDDETTALFFAVKMARLQIVKYLLSKGASTTLVDGQGCTVLHHAVAIDCPEMVHLLLETNVNVNACDCNNQTPLIHAARFAFEPCVAEELLQANADPSCTGDKSLVGHTGRTALHFAAQCNNLAVIEVLINHGANKDVQDHQEQTPLFMAALEGRLEAVQLLIRLGASKDICDQKERTPRDVAAERKYHKIVEFLDSVCSQRVHPSNLVANSSGFGVQCIRPKKSAKKLNTKCSRKVLSSSLSSCGNGQTTINPLTPPNSDGSNYSTTPSPNNVHSSIHGPPHLGLFETCLQSSSVMLSPQFETCNGAGWSPQDNSCMMNAPGGWSRVDFPYEDGCFVANNQRPTACHYQYPQIQHTTGYCNV